MRKANIRLTMLKIQMLEQIMTNDESNDEEWENELNDSENVKISDSRKCSVRETDDLQTIHQHDMQQNGIYIDNLSTSE